MPFDPQIREALQQEVHQLNPDIQFLEPEDPAFPAFLEEVSALSPDLALRIDQAAPDPDADAVRAAFGQSLKKGSFATVLGNAVDRTKKPSARGDRRIRPVTILAGGGALLIILIAITALMPEKDKKKTTVTSSVVTTKQSGQSGKAATTSTTPKSTDLPTSTVDGVKTAPGAINTTASSTAPSSSASSAPAPITPSSTPQYEATQPVTVPSSSVPSSSTIAPSPAVVPIASSSSPVRANVPDVVLPQSSALPVASARPSTAAQSARVVTLSPPSPAVQSAKANTTSTSTRSAAVVAAAPLPNAPTQALVSAPKVAQSPAPTTNAISRMSPQASAETGRSIRPALVSSAPATVPTAQRPAGLISTSPAQSAAEPTRSLVSTGTPTPPRPVALVSSSTTTSAERQVSAGFVQSSAAPAPTSTTDFPPSVPATAALPAQATTAAFTSTSAQNTSPYQPGVVVPLVLDTGIAVYPGATHPIWAHSADGSVWRGVASMSPQNDRILLNFTTVLVRGQAQTLTAYAESNGPGITGRIHVTARNAIQTTVNALLGATSSFVQSQDTQSTTYSSSGVVVQASQAQPNFWLALGGGLAKAFSVPETQTAVLPFGQMNAGESVNVRVDLASNAPTAGIQP